MKKMENAVNFKELVKVENEQCVTSSRKVAEVFGKLHRHVLRDIEALMAKDESKIGPMFYETTMKDYYGRDKKAYLMNRDGFSLLVMGFTGKRALEWKLKYIAAFNAMEEALKKQNRPVELTDDEIVGKAFMIQTARLKEANEKIELLQPKANFYDKFMDGEGLYSWEEVAKMLNVKDKGRNLLMRFLREHGVLTQANVPTQQYMNKNRFKVIAITHLDKGYTRTHCQVTKVTPSGFEWVKNFCEENGYFA